MNKAPNESEKARLIIRAKKLKKKIESGTATVRQLCELYGIYSVLIQSTGRNISSTSS